jgi:hypothetical protein
MKTGPFSWSELRTLMGDMLTLDSRHWDMQYLGWCYGEPFNFHWKDNVLVKKPNDENVYFRALNPYCTHAIVYNRVAAEIFVKKWMPFHDAIDTLLTQLACEYGAYTPHLEYTYLLWTECMFTFCDHIFL